MPYVKYNALKGLGWFTLPLSTSPTVAEREAAAELLSLYAEPTDSGVLSFSTSSPYSKSLFSRAWDPDELIEVLTDIRLPDGTLLNISMPFKELLAASERITKDSAEAAAAQSSKYASQLSQQRNAINPVERAFVMDVRSIWSEPQLTTSWSQPSESSRMKAAGWLSLSGTFSGMQPTPRYNGFVLIPGGSTALPEATYPLQGVAEIYLPETMTQVPGDTRPPRPVRLGGLRYYYIQPKLPEVSMTRGLVGMDMPPTITDRNVLDWMKRYGEQYRVQRLQAAGVGDLAGVFKDLLPTFAAGRLGIGDSPWAGMPDTIKAAVTNYYDVKDPQVLIDEGYTEDDAVQEVFTRASLRASFPIGKSTAKFAQWANDNPYGRINIWCPTNKAKLTAALNRSPLCGMLAFHVDDVKMLRQKLINAYPDMPLKEKEEIFRNTMFALTREIESVELKPFNMAYFAYIAKGMIPQTMINTAVNFYNKEQEEKAERAKKQGVFQAVFSVVVSCIPVIGVPFGLALAAAGAYSNVEAAKKAAEAAEDISRAEVRETAATAEAVTEYQETAIVVKEENREEKINKTNKAMVAIGAVGAGIVTLAAALMD